MVPLGFPSGLRLTCVDWLFCSRLRPKSATLQLSVRRALGRPPPPLSSPMCLPDTIRTVSHWSSRLALLRSKWIKQRLWRYRMPLAASMAILTQRAGLSSTVE